MALITLLRICRSNRNRTKCSISAIINSISALLTIFLIGKRHNFCKCRFIAISVNSNRCHIRTCNINLSKLLNVRSRNRKRTISHTSSCTNCHISSKRRPQIDRAILLINQRLRCHNNVTGLCFDGLFLCLVNVASQSRNQQRRQNCQDDQDDDQLDEGETLFVFQFF